MTTSTDNLNSPPPIPPSPSKEKKKKGPFRTGLIVALFVFFGLTFLYTKFLFDHNLKSGLEWSLTKIHGAEVNIKDLTTSFINADLEINKVEVTNKEGPTQNILQIGTIKFKLLWDALLRGKIVIDESSIKQISLYTTRNSPGIILPKSEEGIIESNETLKEGKDQALSVVKEKFNQNALGDIATLLDGTDAKTYTNDLKETLATEKKIKEIETLVDNKEKEWDLRIKSLPKEDEFKSLIDKVKNTKIDKNPLTAAKQIKELSQNVKEGNEKVKQYTEAVKNLEADIKTVENQYKSIDSIINEDIKSLESRFNIPEIDATSLSIAFFSKMLGQKEEDVKKYVGLAQEYLPKKENVTKNKEEQIKPKARGEGVDIKFPVTIGYPKFWLKKSTISSQSTKESGFSGDLSGTLTNVTDDPSFIKKPASLEVTGNFPKQGFSGVNLVLNANHHLKEVNETLDFSIQNYPVKGIKLSDSSKVGITMAQANSQLKLSGRHDSQGVLLSLRNDFKQAQFDIQSSSEKTKELLNDVLKDINSAYLSAKASGALASLKWDINSNIGSQIAQSLKSVLQNKINNLKQKLRNSVEDKINSQKSALKEKISKLESQYKGKINSEKSKAEEKVKELTDSLSSKSKEKSNKVLDDGKKKLKKLFKF